MKVSNINTSFYPPRTIVKPKQKTTFYNSSQQNEYNIPYTLANISFKRGQKNTKNIDVQSETQKLLKQFDDILASDMDLEDLLRLYEMQVLAQMQQKKNRAQMLLNEAEILANAKHLTDIQKAERMISIQKEFNTLEKNMFKLKPFVIPEPIAPEVDNALIRKFQTAIKEDNFNLDRVYQDYYKDLNNIKTIEELNKKYPKINIPSNPADVIAEKIENTLTRDFYEELDTLMIQGNEQKIYVFITSRIKDVLGKSHKNAQDIYKKTAIPSSMKILQKYEKLRDTNTFASVPQFRKNKKIQISDNDLKLLSIDFDDFVLYVLKEQHLNNKKLNEIKYTNQNITIPVSSLKENCYKFDKTPEKVKSMILTAKIIQAAKRDYENFSNEKLKECLNKLAGTDAGNNDKIFDLIIAFDACNFEQKDKASLIRFLRLMDAVKDNDATLQEALNIIKKDNIRPSETERLNAIEKTRVIEELKLQQKRNQELGYIKSEFDNAINVLYQNNLSSTATACAKYRPENTDVNTIENAKFVIDLISKIEILGKNSVKNTLKNWDTYNYYKENETQSGLLEQAENYARKNDGTIDINRAGIYLDSAGVVLNAPQSLEYIAEKELVNGIIEKSLSKNNAIEYLSKYKEYIQLNNYEKTHLLSFIDNFNLKDSVDKFILKNIIENDYVNTDTISNARLNDNDGVDVTIAACAKQQILDKYMFPRCIDFMSDFERAMTSVATEWGTSGIKRTTKNNKAMEYKMELKLTNHDDRLFASQKDYYFDVFSDKGLH